MNLYALYPRGDKLDLTGSVHPIAVFVNREHAERYRDRMWPGVGEVVPMKPQDALAAMLSRRVAA